MKLDYEDFLRQRGLPQWDRNDPRRQNLIDRRPRMVQEVVQWAQEVWGQGGPGRYNELNRPTASTKPTRSTYPEIAANSVLALINVASALLSRQIKAQAAAFEKDAGFTERLYRRRSQQRRRR